MKKRLDNAKGYVEELDPYRTKTRDGKTILCYVCGLAASVSKKLRIIGCDACSHHFHLDCLDPPLVNPPPITSKWVCPLHMDPSISPHQVSKETKIIPIDKFNTPNQGNIDVILDPDIRTKAKQIEIININGVKYQVPENIIILDFWSKLNKNRDISNGESGDSNQVVDTLPRITPLNRKSEPVIISKSPKTSHSVSPKKPDPIDIGPHPSSSSSKVSCNTTSISSHVPSTSSTSKSLTKQSKLTYLLQAAQQVNDNPKSNTESGLILLGHAASTQPQVPLNMTVKTKKRKSSSKPISSTQRTSNGDHNSTQHRGFNPLRSRGFNRLEKSTPNRTEIPDLKESSKSKTSEDQTVTNLNQPLAKSQFSSKHVDVVPSNHQTSTLDKLFSCQNQIIASPVHAGCQWTGPRHISLGPARSTIFMGRGGPGLYLKSYGPTLDPALGGPGTTR